MLANSTRLGPYEIVAPLGAGGMGAVYRARDTRLEREVAVKVLPVAFGNDSNRRSRFERAAARKTLRQCPAHWHVDRAVIYLGLDERDEAPKQLDLAYEQRDALLVYLKVEPYVDPLRAEPRFQALVKKMNFPP